MFGLIVQLDQYFGLNIDISHSRDEYLVFIVINLFRFVIKFFALRYRLVPLLQHVALLVYCLLEVLQTTFEIGQLEARHKLIFSTIKSSQNATPSKRVCDHILGKSRPYRLNPLAGDVK